MITIKKTGSNRRKPHKDHLWKRFIPGMFTSHTEAIDRLVGDMIGDRIQKSMHKSNLGQGLKGCNSVGVERYSQKRGRT